MSRQSDQRRILTLPVELGAPCSYSAGLRGALGQYLRRTGPRYRKCLPRSAL